MIKPNLNNDALFYKYFGKYFSLVPMRCNSKVLIRSLHIFNHTWHCTCRREGKYASKEHNRDKFALHGYDL